MFIHLFHMPESCKLDVDECLEDVSCICRWMKGVCIYIYTVYIFLIIVLDEEIGIRMIHPSGTVI